MEKSHGGTGAPAASIPEQVIRAAFEHDMRPLVLANAFGVALHANGAGRRLLNRPFLRQLLHRAAAHFASLPDALAWAAQLDDFDAADGTLRHCTARVSQLSVGGSDTPILLCAFDVDDAPIAGAADEAPAAAGDRGPDRPARRASSADTDADTALVPQIRRAVDASPAMLWLADVAGRRIWFSASLLAFTGRSAAEQHGDGWLDAVHPEDVERCAAIYRTCFDSRMPFSLDYRMRGRDGEFRWVMDNGVPHDDDAGGFDGYVGACVDIDERKALEDGLAERTRRLRTGETRRERAPPSRARLRAVVDAPQATPPVPPPAAVAVAGAPAAAHAETTVGIGEVLRSVGAAVEPELAASGHRLTIDLPEPGIALHADAPRLAEAIAGLVAQAGRCMRAPARVALTVRHHDSALFLRVRASEGPRVPDFVPRAFDVLLKHREFSSWARTALAAGPDAAREVVRAHGGELMVFGAGTTAGNGAGTCFESVIRLPLVRDRLAHRATP